MSAPKKNGKKIGISVQEHISEIPEKISIISLKIIDSSECQ